MASLIKQIRTSIQPHGGYIPISAFSYKQHSGNTITLCCKNTDENIIRLAVEYLLKIHISENTDKNYLMIETALRDVPCKNRSELIKKFYEGITSQNPTTATEYAIKLAYIEAYCKFGTLPKNSNPDIEALKDVSAMSERCRSFFGSSINICGFDFEGGYSECITSGNGGYLSSDTLWNVTVSDSVTCFDTLLVLVQYIMGLHSYNSRFLKKIKRLGIYNPRLDAEYTLNISDVAEKVIEDVSKNIIGYN